MVFTLEKKGGSSLSSLFTCACCHLEAWCKMLQILQFGSKMEMVRFTVSILEMVDMNNYDVSRVTIIWKTKGYHQACRKFSVSYLQVKLGLEILICNTKLLEQNIARLWLSSYSSFRNIGLAVMILCIPIQRPTGIKIVELIHHPHRNYCYKLSEIGLIRWWVVALQSWQPHTPHLHHDFF